MNKFYTKLKDLLGKEEYSDAVIKVIECDGQSVLSTPQENYIPTRKRRKNSTKKISHESLPIDQPEEELVYSLPVHRVVIALQCDYFKRMFETDMEEAETKIITIKVAKGDSRYYKLFIEVFYDSDILGKISAYELLRVLEIADQYCCDDLIGQITDILPAVNINGLDECENVAKRVEEKSFGLENVNKAVDFLMEQCAMYISEMFYPLERNMNNISNCFAKIPFNLFLTILKCKKALVWHENTVLYVVCLWLQYSSSRRTAYQINLIFDEIVREDLTTEFLIAVMEEKELLFENWPKFVKWFSKAIGYHVLSQTKLDSKNFKILNNKNEIKSFKFKMVKEDENEYVWDEDGCCVFQGYEISPKISFYDEENLEYFDIKLSLNINNLKILFEDTHHDGDISISLALVIYPENGCDDEMFLNFVNVKKENCCLFTYYLCMDNTVSDYDIPVIGFLRKRLLENKDTFNIVIAFRGIGEAWPDNFPTQLPRRLKINSFT